MIPKQLAWITAGNTNLGTVKSISLKIKDHLVENDLVLQHVWLFADAETERTNIPIYREVLGDVTVTRSPVLTDGRINERDLNSAIRQLKDYQILIDLTNGKKITSSQLYLAGCIYQVAEMYFAIGTINESGNMTYSYEPVEPYKSFDEISRSARVYVDFLGNHLSQYEKDASRFESAMFAHMIEQVRFGVDAFFVGNMRAAVLTISKLFELMSNEVVTAIREQGWTEGLTPEQVRLLDRKKALGYLDAYCNHVRSGHTSTSLVMPSRSLEELVQLFGVLRYYRNIAAHEAVSFDETEAKVCINVAVRIIQIFIGDPTLLWTKERND